MINEKTALIIIDVQKAFEHPKWGKRNNPDAENNIGKLLSVWRPKGWQVIHVQHTSDHPDSLFYPANEGFQIKDEGKPLKEEPVFVKKANSAFIGTNLKDFLEDRSITTTVITGLTTPHCVSTTTRMSANYGFNTFLVSDATAAFGLRDQSGEYYDADTIHRLSLATLYDEFARILTTKQLLDKLA